MCDNGNFFDDCGWEGIAMAGFLAEGMVEAEIEWILIEKDLENDDSDNEEKP